MHLDDAYVEKVYAGVLGKMIGVYLGRPFEGWTYEMIAEKLGDIHYYVHNQLGVPLIVPDDDISGTFTFLRAMADYEFPANLTAKQIGRTWLNYLIEHRTVLWWGGMGNSTEHTAYLRLKAGIDAPESGSMKRNGQIVAEQIGAQIFIDGWPMLFPGDPARAVELAGKAASVSHDGEAIYGAQVVAAMEAQAFVEKDIDQLIATAVSFIPKDAIIYRLIEDVRRWRETEPDWRRARRLLEANYGYDKYGGNCHMVPNHGLIILSLLYGDDDFQKTLMIVNTSGWDTDCNSANVGCIMGIKNGLAGIDAGVDFRGPVADRLFMPTADGGRCVTDAVTETFHVVNTARAMRELPPAQPKDGARFHFELPGAVQGFQIQADDGVAADHVIENVVGHSLLGQRSLALHFRRIGPGRPARMATPTFIRPEDLKPGPYELLASPTLYPGQHVRARVVADPRHDGPVDVGLYVRVYGRRDQLNTVHGPQVRLNPGEDAQLSWTVPDFKGQPIAAIGVEVASDRGMDGTVYVDYLTWDGVPSVSWSVPPDGGTMWQKAWVNGLDHLTFTDEPFRLVQNSGTGLLIQGVREWADYTVTAHIAPHMAEAAGLAARVQGMCRYYALLLSGDGNVQLVKELHGTEVLGTAPFPWKPGVTYRLRLDVQGHRLRGFVDDELYFDVVDDNGPLQSGAVALVCREGRAACQKVRLVPL